MSGAVCCGDRLPTPASRVWQDHRENPEGGGRGVQTHTLYRVASVTLSSVKSAVGERSSPLPISPAWHWIFIMYLILEGKGGREREGGKRFPRCGSNPLLSPKAWNSTPCNRSSEKWPSFSARGTCLINYTFGLGVKLSAQKTANAKKNATVCAALSLWSEGIWNGGAEEEPEMLQWLTDRLTRSLARSPCSREQNPLRSRQLQRETWGSFGWTLTEQQNATQTRISSCGSTVWFHDQPKKKKEKKNWVWDASSYEQLRL